MQIMDFSHRVMFVLQTNGSIRAQLELLEVGGLVLSLELRGVVIRRDGGSKSQAY